MASSYSNCENAATIILDGISTYLKSRGICSDLSNGKLYITDVDDGARVFVDDNMIYLKFRASYQPNWHLDVRLASANCIFQIVRHVEMFCRNHIP